MTILRTRIHQMNIVRRQQYCDPSAIELFKQTQYSAGKLRIKVACRLISQQ
ncbi:Uncharacterised protein [Vibrio cholerae]|uniref:Uncharacterized protein n=1 Tax=Vibrio cholerae TaxID=666 RepID=A0A655R9L5_VIBCL|nr:Uncharacterised protein [Vibrio cholerae]CSC27204.1 Uncharacterised protein [Vibrio cholerae]CSC74356.1 Uncharacterised protein [Vibrio cholerae]CSC85147.1 Uncharacterised protein [Vibrio cholerae]CSC93168.1 Uncharacterised protein [Vibrio cholerae]